MTSPSNARAPRRLMITTTGFDQRDLNNDVEGPLWSATRELDAICSDFGIAPADITYRLPGSASSEVFRTWFGMPDRAVIKLAWSDFPVDHAGLIERLTTVLGATDYATKGASDRLAVLYENDPSYDLAALALLSPGPKTAFAVTNFDTGALPWPNAMPYTRTWFNQNQAGDLAVVDNGDNTTTVVAQRAIKATETGFAQDDPSATIAGLALVSAALIENPFARMHEDPATLDKLYKQYLATDLS